MIKTKYLKNLIGLVIAFLLSFFLVNGIIFFYDRPVAWISTPNGASGAVRRPNALLVHGTEGYSISRLDSNGYSNPDYKLLDNYVLMMGASHTQGLEVAPEKKYSAIVNNVITDNSQELAVYSISSSGHFLPSIIKQFDSAVNNYPNASCITIEIGSIDYSVDELKDACNQPAEIEMSSATELFEQQGLMDKLKNYIKDYFPLISLIKNHIQTAQEEDTGENEASYIDEREYETALAEGLALIRSEYEGPIVILYHPQTIIQEDGTVLIQRGKMINIFRTVCDEVGIDFIDVGDDFLEHYNQFHELPYGFANTTPGSGHLNEVGHQIMSDAILNYLKEVKDK